MRGMNLKIVPRDLWYLPCILHEEFPGTMVKEKFLLAWQWSFSWYLWWDQHFQAFWLFQAEIFSHAWLVIKAVRLLWVQPLINPTVASKDIVITRDWGAVSHDLLREGRGTIYSFEKDFTPSLEYRLDGLMGQILWVWVWRVVSHFQKLKNDVTSKKRQETAKSNQQRLNGQKQHDNKDKKIMTIVHKHHMCSDCIHRSTPFCFTDARRWLLYPSRPIGLEGWATHSWSKPRQPHSFAWASNVVFRQKPQPLRFEPWQVIVCWGQDANWATSYFKKRHSYH